MKLLASATAAVLVVSATVSNAKTNNERQDGCKVIFDFNEVDALAAWETTNDNVMGGRSSGGPSVSDGVLTFSGVTNTDGGGFSSISAFISRRSLAGTKSFRIRFRGEGRPYKFSVETGETRYLIFRIQYWREFETRTGDEWNEAVLPVSEFRAFYHGELIDDRTLDPRRIKDLGFFIYDMEDGPFELQVDWIKACR